MAVVVTLPNGRQRKVNGRHGEIIQTIVENAEEWSKHHRFQIVFHCAGPHVRCEAGEPPPRLEGFDLPPARD